MKRGFPAPTGIKVTACMWMQDIDMEFEDLESMKERSIGLKGLKMWWQISDFV